MWIPDLADAALMAGPLARNAHRLGLDGGVVSCDLVDARISHPHRPESARCAGWAVYDVATTTAASPVRLYVKAFPAEPGARARMRLPRPGDSAVHLPELGVFAWRFPDDPGLPVLGRLVDPVAAVRDLHSLTGRHVLRTGDARVGVDVVRYQPEVSATLRYSVPEEPRTTVFAKALAGTDVAALARRCRLLWRHAQRDDGLRVPEPLAADARGAVLWSRGVPGGPMSSTVTPSTVARAAAAIAGLLAAIHRSRVPLDDVVTPADVVDEAHKKVEKLVVAHPPAAGSLEPLLLRLRRLHDGLGSSPPGTVHGDFHIDQVIAAPDGAVVVDFDSMVRGDAELDVAELLVDLALRDQPVEVLAEFASCLLASYQAARGRALDRSLLRLYAEGEFVNRCYRHLRRSAPGWRSGLERELEQHARLASLLS